MLSGTRLPHHPVHLVADLDVHKQSRTSSWHVLTRPVSLHVSDVRLSSCVPALRLLLADPRHAVTVEVDDTGHSVQDLPPALRLRMRESGAS